MDAPKSPKDRNSIKGAIMRAFARSELHHSILNAAVVKHSDPSRPRVKTWCLCAGCKLPEAKSYMAVDHIIPKILVNSSLAEMTWDELVANTWCNSANLQALCHKCHDIKTKAENSERKRIKKEKRSAS